MLWNKVPQNLFFILTLLFSVFALAEEGFQYDAKGKRDPFSPIVSAKGGFSSDVYGVSSIKDIRLEGIVWDGSANSLVVINGEIFKKEEKIGSVKILEIEEKFVVFDVEGEKVKVELRED